MKPNNRPFNHRRSEPKEFEEKVIQVNRVSKKTKGGNNIGFSVLMVVGDKKGRVGVGLGKSPNVLSSIEKGVRRAKKHLIQVPIKNGTIPFPITIKKGAAKLILKPAPVGTGVIAGGAVRAVVEAAGINNIVTKTLGGSNQASNVYATFAALKKIKQIADLKGIKLESKSLPKPATRHQPTQTFTRSYQAVPAKPQPKKPQLPRRPSSPVRPQPTAKSATPPLSKQPTKSQSKPTPKSTPPQTTPSRTSATNKTNNQPATQKTK